ncbi:hypothetical protein LTR70_000404 [Exophiala xenobiotica]|uniref:Uncharacterized protein n=1 Tax=Lithohypha guttulata TaxID=1690604 RepID=A0ABR0KPQ6_9EURO|nr:hypothetical protein LTR24_000105 [Lithohypha guttulata]KAK5330574.1 hypothetical protein LTR70_000404 [Exophiala xenobiotica]
MARIARDSTPKRRSARLSNQPHGSTRKPVSNVQLDAVLERDETPEAQQPSIDNVVATPSTRKSLDERMRLLSNVTTPKTEPKPANDQMHPATIHQTTAKAPDSGLKLGFADISTTGRASLASLQNTPSRPRQSLAHTNISPSFQFKFSHESNMTEDGRKLMDSIREDAARIKEQLRAEREAEAQREDTFVDATGRKIAKPTAKASRFSDVHMAQFKKMDSIANHPSSYRARAGFARPTEQSLKRSSSKADLDEPDRPRTAGKSPSTRIPPPVIGRPTSISPFKSIQQSPRDAEAPAKRLRRIGDEDISSSRPTTLPQPVSSRLLSPTKASAARIADATSTPNKQSALPRANSVKSMRSVSRPDTAAPMSPSKFPQAQLNKPLPAIPAEIAAASPAKQGLTRSISTKSLAPTLAPEEAPKSRIPTMASLRSILRSPKKSSQPETNTPKHKSTIPMPASSQKKVDFTPSVKSRYATKLAEASPSPAKIDRSNATARDSWQPAIPYNSYAFVVNDPEAEEAWSDDEDDAGGVPVTYPTLPTLSPRPVSRSGRSVGPTTAAVDHTIDAFTSQAREHGRRESKEFKSIFTTLHPRPGSVASSVGSSLTSVNTQVNRTNPIVNASRIASASSTVSTSPRKSQASPSTIRRVRASEPAVAVPVLPFTDIPNANVSAIPHGLPGKKRRHDADFANDKYGRDDDAKENRRITHIPSLPGAWEDSTVEKDEQVQDEGEKRAGKRARHDAPAFSPQKQDNEKEKSPVKRRQTDAREVAAKTARDRKKSMGGISLSRLNALASPKKRA